MLLNIEADAQRIVVIVTAFDFFLIVIFQFSTFIYVSSLEVQLDKYKLNSNKTRRSKIVSRAVARPATSYEC